MPVTRRHVTLALGAGGSTVLFAVALELLWFVIYGLPGVPDREMIALAIWTPLFGVFLALCALTFAGWLERGRHFAVAVATGAATGVAWVVLASVRTGLWIAWLDLPVVVLWPLAGALGIAAVAPPPEQGTGSGRASWPSVAAGLVGLGVFTLALKGWGASWVGPEVREYALGSVPAVPSSSATASVEPAMPELGSGGAPTPSRCYDGAPRPLAIDPPVADSSSPARPIGMFTDRRERDVGGTPHVYGRTLGLWTVEGNVTGILESRSGPVEDPGERAILEFARLDGRTGILTFDAYFADGFVSRFRGVLREDSVAGALSTMDADCMSRVLATDTVVLRRDEHPAEAAPAFHTLMARLVDAGAFRRERPGGWGGARDR